MKTTITFILMLVISSHLFGQSVQKGIVMEYRERLSKRYLEGVELTVNNASSTISNKDGNFQLEFRTLKPGDPIVCRRIEKLGYEIFNKEAIEQWTISKGNVPFTVVMCKSEHFKKIRDKYNGIASQSYTFQQSIEKKKIEQLYKNHELNIEQYKKQIKEIDDYYAEQLEHLDNYVDKFARIDLSELSDTEFQIVQFIQEGNIEKAIQEYEKNEFLLKYLKEIDDLKELYTSEKLLKKEKEQNVNLRDSIYDSIKRQINTYLLAGGRENFHKADSLYKEVVNCDLTKWKPLTDYVFFGDEQHIFSIVEKYGNIALDIAIKNNNTVLKAVLYQLLGSMYSNTGRLDLAEEYFYAANEYFSTLQKTNSIYYTPAYLAMLNDFGLLLRNRKKYQESINIFTQTICGFKELYEVDSLNIEIGKAYIRSLNNLGAVEIQQKLYNSAQKHYLDAISVCAHDSIKLMKEMAMTCNNLGKLYFIEKEYNIAMQYYKKSHKLYHDIYQRNPNSVSMDLAMICDNLGETHINIKDYEEAVSHLKMAFEIKKEFYESANILPKELKYTSFNLGLSLSNLGKMHEAISILKDSYRIIYYGMNEVSKHQTLYEISAAIVGLCKILEFNPDIAIYAILAEDNLKKLKTLDIDTYKNIVENNNTSDYADQTVLWLGLIALWEVDQKEHIIQNGTYKLPDNQYMFYQAVPTVYEKIKEYGVIK